MKADYKTSASLPHGPKGLPFAGNLFPFFRDPISFLMNIARDYGDFVYFKIGPQNLFFINHPDYIEDVLVTRQQDFIKGPAFQWAKAVLGKGLLTSEGDFHRRQRRLAQPAFHRQRIATYGKVMTECSALMGEQWEDGETIDIAQEMMRLTLTIVGKTLFDADVDSEAEEVGEALTMFLEEWWHTIVLAFLPFSGLLAKLPIPSLRRLHKARERLDGVIYRMIADRRARGVDRGDLLSMLLLARDEEGDGGGMTDLQVRDEAVTIFLTGHETTSNALSWTWYLLSQNPDVEAKLHSELERVLGGRLPTIDDVAQLPYTRMVFTEGLRLYPPAWLMGRQALHDVRIDSYVVPANTVCVMSQYVMHHDPRYYPDPFRFDPERWTPEAQSALPRFAFFPFGGGIRGCIGEPFAWMEAVLAIATLAQSWRMRLVPGHPVELQPLMSLRPKHGIRMTLEKRNSFPSYQQTQDRAGTL